MEVSAKPFVKQGKTYILTSFRDISERMEMEAQILLQDRLASVGLLASSLAHEIGTPLGVIRGRAEFLNLQSKGNPMVSQNVEIIISQIDRVSKLIRALLTLARGQGSSPVGQINLQTAVSEVMVFLSHEFERKGVLHSNVIPESIFVLAEAGPLHQVFLILFVNSIHAIEAAIKKGREKDHFLRVWAEESGNLTTLHVVDSGCGISPENRKEIFKPFFTTKDVGVGTGLGLATTYRILEGWGGKIQVKSEEGEGTTFSLTFQRARV